MGKSSVAHAVRSLIPRQLAQAFGTALLLSLAACGGGGGGGSEPNAGTNETPQGNTTAPAPAPSGTAPSPQPAPAPAPVAQAPALPTRVEAFRLATQASFGPTEPLLTQIQSVGASAWVDAQLALPATVTHLPRWRVATAKVKATGQSGAKAVASPNELISSFFERALNADDQLRQRAAFALSQIFVVSLTDLADERAEALADYQDMLARNAFGNFRVLLQEVSTHPAMGMYLSHIKNRKGDPLTGRQPDQNFAREVMQLFSIGLYQLRPDGTVQLDGAGQPVESYSADDIVGLSRVFTGFSWGGADQQSQRFWGTAGYQDANRFAMAMQGYSRFHEAGSKTFLGTGVAAQGVADPAASLKVAMDALFNHPNVGPFIGRQLIQRLVTSHPSPAYVSRVAAAFNNNGLGVRGDMQAVFRAVLLDEEARSSNLAQQDRYGKLREPVLRLTAYLRAFDAKSDSGVVYMGSTDDVTSQLSQTPWRSPSVFNFYRPGYVPPGGEAAALGLTLPEMQITSEGSTVGYVNFMLNAVERGVGLKGPDGKAARPDLQVNLATEIALAEQPEALLTHVQARLLPGPASAALSSEVLAAINSVTIPKPKGDNATVIENAKRHRVLTAIALTLVSPEFIVQK
ncbi:MAG: DUF1800 domain-containing protein [Ideonella sp.]|nr:DUF1800 domain-containing protein [Ideonella sp.]